VRIGSVNFIGMAALGASFAGFLSYQRTPDALTTTIAVVLTFLAALVVLNVLQLALRLAIKALKVVIPAAVLLAVGCAYDWAWAQATVDWLLAVGSEGAQAADQQWTAWRAQ